MARYITTLNLRRTGFQCRWSRIDVIAARLHYDQSGFMPANNGNGPRSRLHSYSGIRSQIDATVKQEVPLIQCFAGSGELHWAASVSRVNECGSIRQCLPFRYSLSAHSQILQRSCRNWRRSLRIPSLQLLWSAQAETRALRRRQRTSLRMP